MVPSGTGRSYGRIVRDNVFNFINNVLFALGITLVALGAVPGRAGLGGRGPGQHRGQPLPGDPGQAHCWTASPCSRVPGPPWCGRGLRREVDPSEIVLGDVLELEPGDQIVVDGQMVGRGRMEVDESMLTGESDAVPKTAGDLLFSGSFVVNGGGLMEVQKVGMESFAARIAAGAQAFRRVRTPLQEQVNLVIRALLLMVVYFEILVIVKALVEDTAFVETVRMSTVIVALVPNGLILAIALAYALGAVRMAGKGALIQQANAVESLSHVDVLCTDKTGTLTTNNIKMDELLPLGDGASRRRPRSRMRGGSSATTPPAPWPATAPPRRSWRHTAARPGRCGRRCSSHRPASGVPWSSPTPTCPGVYVLGAPEIWRRTWRQGDAVDGHAAEWTAAGLRVLLLAHKAVLDGPLNGPDGSGRTARTVSHPLALISLRDELRPMARETLEGFSAAGVQLEGDLRRQPADRGRPGRAGRVPAGPARGLGGGAGGTGPGPSSPTSPTRPPSSAG